MCKTTFWEVRVINYNDDTFIESSKTISRFIDKDSALEFAKDLADERPILKGKIYVMRV